MYIIRPNVELWENKNHVQHIARCASVCYGSKGKRPFDEEKDKKLVENLIASRHLSVLRHDTVYFLIPEEDYKKNDDLYADIITLNNYNAYVNVKFNKNNDCFISVNGQWSYENGWFIGKWKQYVVDENDIKEYPTGNDIRRFTFCITTQISTSREFNRVSPNAISEESTRYCNYTKEKFDNHITICQPFWIDVLDAFETQYEATEPIEKVRFNGKNISAYVNDKLITKKFSEFNVEVLSDVKTQQHAKVFLGFLHKETTHYIDMVRYGLIPQEARELLPLCTATTVVYTYSIEEWVKILLLRYYGVTGAPHPNAKIIANRIKYLLEEQGYDINNIANNMCKELYNKSLF